MEARLGMAERKTTTLERKSYRRLGRWQFRLTLMKHVSPSVPDRWVLHTSTVYDRKGA
jgi:hypothetical protein